jgi:hypothetical protein
VRANLAFLNASGKIQFAVRTITVIRLGCKGEIVVIVRYATQPIPVALQGNQREVLLFVPQMILEA